MDREVDGISPQNWLVRLQVSMPGGTLDPVIANETIAGEIIDNVYEKLFTYKQDRLVPQLVSGYTVEKGRIYRLHLRDDVYFHDKTKCDAFAIKSSLQRMLKISKKARNLFDGVLSESSFLCEDEHTLVIETNRVVVDLFEKFAIRESSIISRYLQDDPEQMSYKACGTGPFYLDAVNRTEKTIELKKFEDYWGDSVALDGIIIVSEIDYDKRKRLFLSGKADIMAVQSSKLIDFQSMNSVKIDTFPALDMALFTLNLQNTFLKSNDVRMAIRFCFDYDTYLLQGRNSLGKKLGSAIPFGVFGHHEGLTSIYSPELISKYLATHRTDLSKLSPLKILTIAGMEDAQYACNMLSFHLNSIGISSEIIALPFNEFCQIRDLGDFDISFLSWAPDTALPESFLFDFYHSKGSVARSVGLSNPILDAKIEHIVNYEKRELKFQEILKIQEMGESSNVYMWLYQGLNLKVYNSFISGVTHNLLDGDYNFRTIKKSDARYGR